MELLETLKARTVLINYELDRILDVGDQPTLKSAMRHLPLVKTGKRLRPLLAMLCAEAISEGPSGRGSMRTIPFALALEVIHNFTLLHDDIMDEDEIRRGVPTVHIAYGIPTAINAGDALFARAFEILATIEVDDRTLRRIFKDVAKMVREIGEGQQWDLDFGLRWDVKMTEYLKMVELKTARIFQMAAKGGTLIGGGTEKQVANMEEYGRLIGIGFQILDDILDFKRDSSLKDLGSDIRKGKRTLILIHALENLKADDSARDELLGIVGNNNATLDDIKHAVKILTDCGSIDYASNYAKQFGEQALAKLHVLSESESKMILTSFANFMVEGRRF